MSCDTSITIGFPVDGAFPAVPNLDALRSLPLVGILNAENYVVNGGVSAGDGSGGVYVFVGSSLDTDDGYATIKPDALTSLQAGRWKLVQIPRRINNYIWLSDFGVVGDGVTDDTAAMQVLAAYVNARSGGAGFNVGRATVRISASLTFTKPVAFFGEGVATSAFALYNNARIICDGNRIEQQSFGFHDMSILTDGIHTSSPLKVDYSPHNDGKLTNTFTMRDCVISGRNDTSGFQIGLEMVDCPWPTLENVAIIGDEGRGFAALSGYGVKYTGKDGSGSFKRVRGYSLADFIYCEGEMEGLLFDGCEAVSVQRGISCKDTSGGAQPYFVFRNNHLNTEETGIILVGIDKFDIDGSNLLYAQVARQQATSYTAVDITPTLATGPTDQLVLSGRCSPQINGDGGYASVKIGTRIRGAVVSLEDYVIAGRYQGLSVGVQLDSGSNGAHVVEDISFRNTVTPILNGGNNIIQGGGYAYGVATLPNGSATTLLGGTRLFVADAAGGAMYGTLAVGGGTTPSPVYYDGANWRIG